MSYNGSGTFLINTAGQPVVSGTVISSTAFNALTADLATGLSTAITKDGQTTVTANIPMGTYKFTGLGAGTAATDSANLSQVQSTVTKLLASVSGADTITAVGSPTLGAYASGQMFYFVAVGANTGAVTINIDSLGAKSITRDGTTALAAGDIQSGEVCVIVYDGTQFQLVNGASQSASIVTENLTVNKATVLNESGGDNDTRIEGDTDANLFFADASTDRVGIGTSSPSNKLTVSGNADVTGNLGIGTTSPVSKLDVTGAFGTSTTAFTIVNSSSYSATNIARMDFRVQNSFGGTERIAAIWGINPNALGNNGGALVFGVSANGTATTPSEVARFDQAGNLGLGVTPSAWQTGSAIQLADAQSYSRYGMVRNAYYDGAAYKYITSAPAALYQQSANEHLWYNAPSGTAGNTISFTQAMTLDASGNLLVGATANPGVLNTSVVVNSGANSLAGLVLQNNSTGTGSTDGSHIAIAGTEFLIVNAENAAMVFKTNNTERARITSGGVYLVGTTNTAGSAGVGIKLHPDGLVSTVSTTSISDSYNYYNETAGAYRFYVTNGGTVFATNTTISAISDQRLKENIRDLDAGLDAVMALKPRKFDWKEGKGQDKKDVRGFIAQEFEQVFPDLIDTWKDPAPEGEEPYKSVRQDLIPVLVKAIQELKAELDEAKAKIAALETK